MLSAQTDLRNRRSVSKAVSSVNATERPNQIYLDDELYSGDSEIIGDATDGLIQIYSDDELYSDDSEIIENTINETETKPIKQLQMSTTNYENLSKKIESHYISWPIYTVTLIFVIFSIIVAAIITAFSIPVHFRTVSITRPETANRATISSNNDVTTENIVANNQVLSEPNAIVPIGSFAYVNLIPNSEDPSLSVRNAYPRMTGAGRRDANGSLDMSSTCWLINTSLNNTEVLAMYVAPNGNIGFGHVDPVEQIDIARNLKVRGTFTLGDPTLFTSTPDEGLRIFAQRYINTTVAYNITTNNVTTTHYRNVTSTMSTLGIQMSPTGNVTINGNLIVPGSMAVTLLNIQSLDINGTFESHGTATFLGGVDVYHHLNVTGNTTMHSPVFLHAPMTTTASIYLPTGTITLDTGNLNMGSGILTTNSLSARNLTITENVYIGGNGVFNGSYRITGDTHIDGSLFITGNVTTMNRFISVTNVNITDAVYGEIEVTNLATIFQATVSNALTVGGLTTTASLYVTGTSNLVGALSGTSGVFSGNLSVSNLTVSNSATVGGLTTSASLYVTGTSNLVGALSGTSGVFSGNLSVSNIAVSNSATIGGLTTTASLYVTGTSNLVGALSGTSGVFSGNLNVTGVLTGSSAVLSSTLAVAGLLVARNLTITENIYIGGNGVFNGSYRITGDTHIDGNVFITGNVTTMNKFISITNVNITDAIYGEIEVTNFATIHQATILNALTIGGLTTTASLYVTGTSNLVGTLSGTSGVFSGSFTVSNALTVGGLFNTTSLYVTGTSNLIGALSGTSGVFSGNLSVSNLVVSNSATIGGLTTTASLYVTGTSNLVGALSGTSGVFSGNLNVAGVFTGSSAVLSSTLGVSGIFTGSSAVLSSTLGVSGLFTGSSAILSSTLNVSGAFTVGVSGLSTFNGAVLVNNNLYMNGASSGFIVMGTLTDTPPAGSITTYSSYIRSFGGLYAISNGANTGLYVGPNGESAPSGGNAKITGTLQLGGTLTGTVGVFSSTVTIGDALTVNNGGTINGAPLVVTSGLSVTNGSSITVTTGNINVNTGDVTLSSTGTVRAGNGIFENLTVTGTYTASTTVISEQQAENLIINGTLFVGSTSTFNGTGSFHNGLSVTSGSTYIGGVLNVDKQATFYGNTMIATNGILYTYGGVHITSTSDGLINRGLYVGSEIVNAPNGGSGVFQHNLAVGGFITIGTTLTVTGAFTGSTGTFSSTLGVTGAFTGSSGTFSSTLGVTGAFTGSSGTFSSTLGVTGAFTGTTGTFSSTLGVTGALTGSSGTFSTTLGVTGAFSGSSGTFSSTLGVTGAFTGTSGTFSSTLGVTTSITTPLITSSASLTINSATNQDIIFDALGSGSIRMNSLQSSGGLVLTQSDNNDLKAFKILGADGTTGIAIGAWQKTTPYSELRSIIMGISTGATESPFGPIWFGAGESTTIFGDVDLGTARTHAPGGIFVNHNIGLNGNIKLVSGTIDGVSASFSSTLGVTGAFSGTSGTFSTTLGVTGLITAANGVLATGGNIVTNVGLIQSKKGLYATNNGANSGLRVGDDTTPAPFAGSAFIQDVLQVGGVGQFDFSVTIAAGLAVDGAATNINKGLKINSNGGNTGLRVGNNVLPPPFGGYAEIENDLIVGGVLGVGGYVSISGSGKTATVQTVSESSGLVYNDARVRLDGACLTPQHGLHASTTVLGGDAPHRGLLVGLVTGLGGGGIPSGGDAYIQGTLTAGAVTVVSSQRVKTNITDLTSADARSVVMGINAKTYWYIKTYVPDQPVQKAGFIAEHVINKTTEFYKLGSSTWIPLLDNTTLTNVPTLAKDEMIPFLWKFTQDLDPRIATLEAITTQQNATIIQQAAIITQQNATITAILARLAAAGIP